MMMTGWSFAHGRAYAAARRPWRRRRPCVAARQNCSVSLNDGRTRMRQHAARELDRNRRRVALVDGEQAGLDAQAVVLIVVDALLERLASGCTKPYDSRMPRNVPTSAAPTWWPISAGRAVDVAHRDHDAEHGGHDAEAGQRVANLRERGRGPQRLVVVHLQVLVHQRLEVVRRDAADDDDLGRVGEEVHRLVPRQELRIARRASGSSPDPRSAPRATSRPTAAPA